MIYYVCRAAYADAFMRFVEGFREAKQLLQMISYEDLLQAEAVPLGHYVFADHDRLSAIELERAGAIARRLKARDPAVQILNDPPLVLGRYALLRDLSRRGMNPYDVARLDEGRSMRFPIYVRWETHDRQPTGLIQNEADYIAALARLSAVGKTRKDRVAVQVVDTRSPDGKYRKYGAFRIGDSILPHHVFVGDHWYVKRKQKILTSATIEEELDYVRTNPHRAALKRIFDIARIQYGRIDYAIVGDSVVTFEINTHPGLPRATRADGRDLRREAVVAAMLVAFANIDTELHIEGDVSLRGLPTPEVLLHTGQLL